MRSYLLMLACCCFVSTAFAQEESTTIPNKSFFAEVGGPGVLFSANFDTRFKKSPLGLGARVGLGFVTADEEIYDPNNPNAGWDYKSRSVITVPVQLNYIFGKPQSVNAFEVGLGFTYVGKKLSVLDYYGEEATQVLGTASFMYRRLPKDGGFSWRIGFTPLFAKGLIQPFGGVSVGYNF